MGDGGRSLETKQKNSFFFLIFFLFSFHSFQQHFHWLGKTAIIAIGMTKWIFKTQNGNDFLAFLKNDFKLRDTHSERNRNGNLIFFFFFCCSVRCVCVWGLARPTPRHTSSGESSFQYYFSSIEETLHLSSSGHTHTHSATRQIQISKNAAIRG